jgi:RNA polymerase sigma-70 factor (ECF subfamily)
VTSPSDGELARRACNGDMAAMEALVTRALPIVRGLARRLAADLEEGDALAQEAFVFALEKLERYRAEAAFSTWVCSIALRRHAEAARRMAIERRALGRASRGDERDPADLATARSAARRLWLVVAKLPARHRDAIIARATSDTGAEAAARLDMTPNAFRVRLYRARIALRDLMMRECPDFLEEFRYAER